MSLELSAFLPKSSRMPRTRRAGRKYHLRRLLTTLHGTHTYFTDVIGVYPNEEANKENGVPYHLIPITFDRKAVPVSHLAPHEPRTPRYLKIEAEFTGITEQSLY
ncbi:uncharacterized protein LOC124955448 [Vespa velutina]|uniref:uncharacterized protein LOC124955448 n=1 Tax=Vespa velutina TaxID=202808 RepID=UPI001FB4D70A|nr:uncharacterized protein LOC124955448 [Vespa velutina]